MMIPKDDGVFGLNAAAAFSAQLLVSESLASIRQLSKPFRLFWRTLRRFTNWSGKRDNKGSQPRRPTRRADRRAAHCPAIPTSEDERRICGRGIGQVLHPIHCADR